MKPEQKLQFDNGYGGFDLDRNEYVIKVGPDKKPPKPWVNILANPDFGCLVTESGGMFSWYQNSSLFRITPRVDDYLTEESGEVLYLKNESSGHVQSVFPGNPKQEDPEFLVRHGWGYSVFESEKEEIGLITTIYCDSKKPRKYVHVTVKNHSKAEKELSLTYFAQFVLDEFPERSIGGIAMKYDEKSGLILSKNPYSKYYPNEIAFLGVSETNRTYSLDRKEFFGLNNYREYPKGLAQKELSGRNIEANDPGASLKTKFKVGPKGIKKVIFTLGVTRQEEIQKVKSEIRDKDKIENELEKNIRHFKNLNKPFKIETPDKALDILFNSRLLYQTVTSRFWAKTGFYQPGGAFGFRDQLQDVDALVWSEPETVRRHLVLAASRQFPGGDVQHWWHPPRGDGVRSQSSDAHLWLVHILNHYLTVTGDWSILDEQIPYLEPHKPEHQYNSYFVPIPTEEKATLYEHAIVAIERTLYLSGIHGLPLMLAGDWNDSLSRIGIEKKGESIFMGMFLARILADFLPVVEKRKDSERVKRYRTHIEDLKKTINRDGWDGQWYLRAFWDDGAKLGTKSDSACKIDGLVQNWAIISGVASQEYAQKALESVSKILLDRENQLVKLLDPPFTREYPRDPGYILDYPPGTRENGGAYSHNGAWTAQAFAIHGDGTSAMETIGFLNPILKTETQKRADRYGGEPYAMAGDIYSYGGYSGKAGWTWYTGSAAVLYGVIVEHIVGLKIRGESVQIDPCIPTSWKSFRVVMNFKNTVWNIGFDNPKKVSRGVKKIIFDGREISIDKLKLKKDKSTHEVEVILG